MRRQLSRRRGKPKHRRELPADRKALTRKPLWRSETKSSSLFQTMGGAVKESEKRYQSLFQNTRDAIFITASDGKVIDFNQAWLDLFGYTKEEILKLDARELYANAADRAEFQKKLEQEGFVKDFETKARRKDGALRDCLLTSVAWRNEEGRILGYQGITRDITERKRSENELRLSEERFRKIFDSSPIPTLITLPEGPIVDVNDAWLRMTGFTREEVIGRSTTELGMLPDPGQRNRVLEDLLEKRRLSNVEIVRRTKSGELRDILNTLELVELNGQTCILNMQVDITERKKMEEEIRSLARFPSENPNPVLRLNKDGIILTANPASKLILQEWGSEVGQVAPKLWRDLIADALSTRQDKNVDIEFGDGFYSFLLRPVKEADYVNLYGRDITERKKMEDAIRRRADELAALEATVLDITNQRELPTLLELIVERACNLLGAPSGSLYLCDPERREVRCVVAHRTPSDFTRKTLKYGEGASGIVANTGEPLIIDDYRTWKDRAAMFEKESPFVSVLSVPMKWQGQVIGVINALANTTHRFTQADQDLLRIFANHAATAVENARLLEQERRHATELERRVVERTEELVESERRFRELSDLLPQIVFEIDSNNNLTFLNQTGLESTGYTRDEFRHGLSALQMFVPEDCSRVKENMRRILKGEESRGNEYTVQRKDGTTFPVIAHSAPIIRDGGPVGLRGIVVDITERKQLEQRLIRAERLAAIGELAAMVGHDLRNPLQAIASAAYILKTHASGPIDDERKESLQIIESSIAYSDKIINDLLQYSAEIKLDRSPTDPQSLLAGALSLVRVPENIQVVNRTQTEPKINADVGKVRRAFLNLISNAVDAMPQGGTLTISSKEMDGYAEFVFTDTGTGMTKQMLSRLWTPLFTTKARGMGLGLSITKRIIEAHGGSISADSTMGKGSTFTIKLPIKSQEVKYNERTS